MTDYQEACIRQEAAQTMKANCVEFLQTFAQEYVEKWVTKTGDGAKAEGWAILQAMVALRDTPL
jgi:hypothetical protein